MSCCSRTGWIWTISICLLAVTIGLLAGSWAVLTPHEWGLKMNTVTVTFDDSETYTSGRIYVGPGSYFVKFPRKLRYVEFSNQYALDVWSRDGQNILIEGSFYYQLRPDRIHDIFYKFGDQYEKIIVGMAAETIRDVATQYTTIEFFGNRTEIDASMSAALESRIYQDAMANVTLFNLLAIDVPNAFENAIIGKVITAQDVNTLTVLRTSQLYRTEIQVVNAQASANITLINATAAAQGLLIEKTMQATLVKQLQEARATELARLASDLGFTSPSNALDYIYTDIIRGRISSPSSVSFDTSKIQARFA